jgi:hypothetical protein
MVTRPMVMQAHVHTTPMPFPAKQRASYAGGTLVWNTCCVAARDVRIARVSPNT